MPFFFWTKIYIFIKNWSTNFNNFIYGLKSGSKRNRPNYDKEIQGQKNQVPQEKKSIKLEIQTFIQPYPSLPTNYDVKTSFQLIKAFNGLTNPLVISCSIGKMILTASSEGPLSGHLKY